MASYPVSYLIVPERNGRKLEFLHDILKQIKVLPHAVILTVLLAIAFIGIQENVGLIKNKLVSLFSKPLIVAFLFYLSVILLITIFSRRQTYPCNNILTGFGVFYDGKLNLDLIENNMLFIPYSFLYIVAFHPSKPWKASLLLSIYTSCTIEVLQLLLWLGEFQLSDIVHNVSGGIIGCGIYCLCRLAHDWVKHK